MAAQAFGVFPYLPRELQDIVWKQAAASRSKELIKPAAHFFTVFNVNEDDMSSVQQLVGGNHSLYRLAEPRHNLSPRGDLSAYLVDGGLWTACKNSRRAMEKRYEVAEWRVQMAHCKSLDVSKNMVEWWKWRRVVEAAPATRYLHSTNQGDRFFTVRPGSDLIVLQPMDWMTMDLSNLGRDYAAMFGGFKTGSWVRHIAFEFDPSWPVNIDPRNPPADGPYRAVLDALQQAVALGGLPAHNIWLIDYGIQRRTRSDPVHANQPRIVFYGNRCRFTEVRFMDKDWRMAGYRLVDDFACDIVDTAFARDEDGSSEKPSPTYFGILAGEMLDE